MKTQTPKLVILEAYCVNMDAEYIDDSRIIKNTYGMKWSKNKLRAMSVSAPKERQREFLIGPLQYHGRYAELKKEDYLTYQANERMYKYWKGFGNNMVVTPQTRNDISGVSQEIDLSPKVEKYYKKIIKLTRRKNIPLLIVVSPYSRINEQEQGRYLKAAEIAEKYGISFINFNLFYDEIGMDFNSDFADGDHLSYLGNRKYTKYLGQYLKQNYELPDRREDKTYDSWNMNLKYYTKSLYGKELQQCTDLNDYFEHIATEDCIAIFTASDVSMWREIKNKTYSDLSCATLVKSEDQVVYQSNEEDTWHSKIKGADFAISCSRQIDSAGSMKFQHTINVGLSEYQKVSDGINVVIFNAYTNEVADAVGFDAANGFSIVR